VGQLDHMVDAGLLKPQNRALVGRAATPEAALDHLAAWVPVYVEKWLTPDER
jgi:hypothetical protein